MIAHHAPKSPRSPRENRQGIALVVVLAMLVLLSGLLVAFVVSATTERGAAQANASGATVRQLADTAVNVVIGQIREATNQPTEGVTWASQPGAIRTYSGQLSASKTTLSGFPAGTYYHPYTNGETDNVYKLYSADNLKVSAAAYGSTDLPAETAVIQKWDRTNPTPDYVDLNEPILRPRFDLAANGSVVEALYPIIDPRAKFDANENPNPGATPGIVDGFDAEYQLDPKLHLAGSGTSLPYLPMPVKWLYVLRDGTVGGAAQGTLSNPIVGRIAFWTDDESCKLNVNTASEGTFWDTPSTSTVAEAGQVGGSVGGITSSPAFTLSLGVSQPTRGEFQRYSGHPMTTCLSPALGWLWGVSPTMQVYPFAKTSNGTNYSDFKTALYGMVPFAPAGAGTSEGATHNPDPDLNDSDATAAGHVPPLTVNTKHLYATVDEMIFNDQHRGLGQPTLETNNPLTPEALEKVRFFLTANSRAPEVNLFGRPRVTFWPVTANAVQSTQFDDLFAFTSTLGPNLKYYLTRTDATSPVLDYNTQNDGLYKYLQNLTNQPEPGFGGTFLSKYPTSRTPPNAGVVERDQILTEIFDYSRTTNLVDTGEVSRAGSNFRPYTPRFFPPGNYDSYSRQARSVDWSGQVVPLKPTNGTNTMGMGRFVTVSQAALIFYGSGPSNSPTSTQAQMRGVLALEIATPMPGYPALRETYWTRVTATRPLLVKMGGQPNFINAQLCTLPLDNICNMSAHEITDGRGFMPTMGFTSAMHWFPENKAPTHPTMYPNPNSDPNRTQSFTVGMKTFDSTTVSVDTHTKRQTSPSDLTGTVTHYPYVTAALPIDQSSPNNRTIQINGPALTVEIFQGEAPDDPRSDRNHPIQTIHLDFGGGVPTNAISIPAYAANTDYSFEKRFADTSLDGASMCINSTDIVRSIEYTGGFVDQTEQPPSGLQRAGDLRILAMTPNVPASWYAPRGGTNIYKSNVAQVHGLHIGHGDPVGQGFYGAYGKLAPNSTIRTSKPPLLPAGVNGVLRADSGPGDWDRGLSKHMDGAFGNKVDEGNVKFDFTESPASYQIPYYHGRNIADTGESYFSPNRELPSVAMIGSLPTGVARNLPWQTILLRPDREIGSGHPGAAFPPDHLLLDLFHLPIVEPYAISEPFSTAGKVNLNCVLAPFGYAKGGGGLKPNTVVPRSYIQRDTALRGVLKSTFMMAVPTSTPDGGHTEDAYSQSSAQYRYPIDLDRTMDEVAARLNDQRTAVAGRPTTLFRSPSEICDIDLYPQGLTVGDWRTFWDTQYALTGDNMRERPYAHIYPRLTTKSNVFTAHVRCQLIQKAPGSNPASFDPVHDRVVSEYRGSSIIERFVDPNDTNAQSQQPFLASYDPTHEKLDAYYRYRIVATKQLTPR